MTIRKLDKQIRKNYATYSNTSNVCYDDYLEVIAESLILGAKIKSKIISISAVDLLECFSLLVSNKSNKELRVLIEVFLSSYIYYVITQSSMKDIRESVLSLQSTINSSEEPFTIDMSNIDLDIVESIVLELDSIIKPIRKRTILENEAYDDCNIGFLGWSIGNKYINFIISWEPLSE